ncbi:DDE superfamily endonuclease, CENP-B-like protein [Pochonia chlamydosporia 170]|uniref:DDE superfamily endonuclease, CENP-B-like protein n=1 Tax=Pochonia chlamydosporia 170 TaxID=1380566 RepID=A0A179F0S2_METCM|nr:DDE superfamily endonuclease, CENP-B-like protein [Pochonia chlamydosporia 170]OAQ59065.2 DDE superfamily endonuclease, CENP-B-like protein [Pochonia chlamydosporia 170]
MWPQFDKLPLELRKEIWKYATPPQIVQVHITTQNNLHGGGFHRAVRRSTQTKKRGNVRPLNLPLTRFLKTVSRSKYPSNLPYVPGADVIYFTGPCGGFFDVFAATYPNLSLPSVAIQASTGEIENNLQLEYICKTFPYLKEILVLTRLSDTTTEQLEAARDKCRTKLRKRGDACLSLMQNCLVAEVVIHQQVNIYFGEDAGTGPDSPIEVYGQVGTSPPASYSILLKNKQGKISEEENIRVGFAFLRAGIRRP